MQDKPYTKVEDLAAVYQILVDKNAEGTATITITDDLMDRYGITLQELQDQAMQNMDILQPYSFRGLNEKIKDMFSEDIAREEGIDLNEAEGKAEQIMSHIPEIMFVLTNDTGMYGAAAILNDSIRQEIAEKVGDFYVLPSSIHETLIVPKDAGMDLKELEQMVQEANRTEVRQRNNSRITYMNMMGKNMNCSAVTGQRNALSRKRKKEKAGRNVFP